ncbi:hypothetical protein [Novosphingobium taihuense]|uniref:Uncharacterized protein n=1 Tax=Novosphingobium taihuense TaxID=260085 RepID=A0A7W7AEX9_9SPHN|nr:hypothetical protein [Novosphingobium taihuense]MBB4615758.1 hypothetical protein [Novosphingobium taihuense]TWH79712.1 hypothetical protein IQ25_03923 [Novosphingobium taihuense]
MTQTDMEAEVADLSDLLEGLISKPVKDELAVHFEEVASCFDRQRKRFAAQVAEVQDVTTTEAKRLRSKLNGIETALDQLSAQAADDVAVDRNQAAKQFEVLQGQFAAVLDRVVVLAGEQQAWREDVRLAMETAAIRQLSQMEQEESARRRQTRTLALLVPFAGLLGAGAVELLHLFA